MSTAQLSLTLLLGGLAEVALLGVFVFLGQPQPLGGAPLRFHPLDVAYVAVPFALAAAAALVPLRAFFRRRGQV